MDDFVAAVKKFYPPPDSAADSEISLLLNGSFPLTIQQFFNYLGSTVPYTPIVEGGVCTPKLLGGDNTVIIVYEDVEILEPALDTAIVKVARPADLPTRIADLAHYRGTDHTGWIHIYHPQRGLLYLLMFSVPEVGGLSESTALAKHLLSRIPEWRDASMENLQFQHEEIECSWGESYQTYFSRSGESYRTFSWTKEHFRWVESRLCWLISIRVWVS